MARGKKPEFIGIEFQSKQTTFDGVVTARAGERERKVNREMYGLIWLSALYWRLFKLTR
ncbi:hypothetical protein BaRGS_00025631, partial [Batillaria attramentaria]